MEIHNSSVISNINYFNPIVTQTLCMHDIRLTIAYKMLYWYSHHSGGKKNVVVYVVLTMQYTRPRLHCSNVLKATANYKFSAFVAKLHNARLAPVGVLSRIWSLSPKPRPSTVLIVLALVRTLGGTPIIVDNYSLPLLE